MGAGLGRALQHGARVPFPWLLAVPACLSSSRRCCLPCLSLVCFYSSEGAVLPQFPLCSSFHSPLHVSIYIHTAFDTSFMGISIHFTDTAITEPGFTRETSGERSTEPP